jgi:hypothetical protein
MPALNPISKANRGRCRFNKIPAPWIAAMCVAIFAARSAKAFDDYDGSDSSTSDRPYIDGGDFLNPLNWDWKASVPVQNLSPLDSEDTDSVTAATGFIASPDPNITINGGPLIDSITDPSGNPVQGAVFDPVGFGDSLSDVFLPQIYVGSDPGKIGSVAQPNVLTVKSGTLESGLDPSIAVGRDTDGEIIQTGGTVAADYDLELGGYTNSSDFEQKDLDTVGIYDYFGGQLLAGTNEEGSIGDPGIRLGRTSGDVGIMEIHNTDGANNQIDATILKVSYQQGAIGMFNFYYENGGVTTVNLTRGNATGDIGGPGEFQLRNWGTGTPTFGTGVDGCGGTIGSVLNLSLNSAPALTAGIPQNLALFTYLERTRDHDASLDDDFFTTSGVDLTQGSAVSAIYDNILYTWDISYTGSIDGAIGANIPSADILGTGGNNQTGGAVVLMGVSAMAIPEPTTLTLLAGVGSLMLARRRIKKGR